MSFARRRRPGLLGTVARTAVVAGTANATANAVNRRSQERAQERRPAPAPPPAPPPDAPDLVGQLTELARLREAGLLTAEEFEAAKARLLAR